MSCRVHGTGQRHRWICPAAHHEPCLAPAVMPGTPCHASEAAPCALCPAPEAVPSPCLPARQAALVMLAVPWWHPWATLRGLPSLEVRRGLSPTGQTGTYAARPTRMVPPWSCMPSTIFLQSSRLGISSAHAPLPRRTPVAVLCWPSAAGGPGSGQACKCSHRTVCKHCHLFGR